ncbi:MAG: hypothetical protein ACMUIG_05110 [Thermoplasmatota archaeon]
MKQIALVIAVLGLVANLILAGYLYADIDEQEGENPTDDIKETEEKSDITTLTVPAYKIGDSIKYDYELFAEMYWENKTSGDWEKYTFEGEGELLQDVNDIVNVEDGFQVRHDAVQLDYLTLAHFELTVAGKEDGQEKEEVTIPGSIDVQRSEFRNLFDNHPIKSTNAGTLAIEGLGSAFQEIAVDVEYIADLRTYPDPNLDPEVTLDEAIFANQQNLNLYSSGVHSPEPLPGETYRFYNWSVMGAYKLHDYDTFKVNVTSDFWGFFNFNREFYITSEFPFPIKGFTRTNTSYEDENGVFYIILETRRDLADEFEPLKKGTEVINWGDTTNHEDYLELHPAGEYERWGLAPADGTDVEYSSFAGLTLNEAIDFAKANSKDFTDFMDGHPSGGPVVLAGAGWNRSTEDNRKTNTTTWWNITLGYVVEPEEYYEGYGEEDWKPPEWQYRILVAHSVDEKLTGTETSTFIARDEGDHSHGYIRGAVGADDIAVSGKILTTTHAEKILRIDSKVKAETFESNKIREGVNFYYGIVGMSRDQNPGFALIEQLTGIQSPTVQNAYLIQDDQVWTSGSTFSAAVEANTGRLVYVTTIEGSQLASIFGGG